LELQEEINFTPAPPQHQPPHHQHKKTATETTMKRTAINELWYINDIFWCLLDLKKSDMNSPTRLLDHDSRV